MAQATLGYAGKLVGNMVLPGFGGFVGATIGGAIGGVVDRAIFADEGGDPRHTQGPRLADLVITSTTLGRAIPKLWGTMICGSNIIQSSGIVEHANVETLAVPGDKKTMSKGKGPAPDTHTTFTYTLTFAVGFCEGPAEAILRMWAGNELIYDVTGTGPVSSMGGNIRLYLGTEDQLPDPALEALVGAENALAYRGLVYAVFDTVLVTGPPPQITAEIAMVSSDATATGTIDTAALLETAALFANFVAAITENSTNSTLYLLDTVGLTEIFNITVDAGPWEHGSSTYNVQPIADGSLPIDLNGQIYLGRVGLFGTASFWRYDALTGKLTGRTTITDHGGGLYSGDYPDTFLGMEDAVIIGRFGAQKLVVVGVTASTLGCRIATYDVSPLANTDTEVAAGIDLLPQIATNELSGFLSTTITPDGPCLAGDADGNIWLSAAGSDGNGYLLKVDPVTCVPLETNTLTGRQYLKALLYYEAENALLTFQETSPSSGIWDLVKWDIDDAAITATLRLPGGISIEKSSPMLRQGVISHRIWVGEGENLYYQIDVSGDMSLARTETITGHAGNTQLALYSPLQHALVLNDFPAFSFEHVHVHYLDRQIGGTTTLRQVCEDICEEAGLDPDTDVDATALTDTVRGYALSSRQPAVGGIKALIPAFQFDARESDWQIEFVKRGGGIDVTIPAEDLAARSDLNADVPEIVEIRGQETELPERIDVTYPSVERDYETGDQHARRVREAITTRAQITLDLPVKLSDTEAKNAVERLLDLTWIARDRYTIALTLEYIRIDAADVLRVTLADGTTRDIFVQQVNVGTDGVIQIEGTRNDPAVFDFDYVGASSLEFVETAVRFAGPSALYVLDIPLLKDSDDGLGMYVAGGPYGDTPWPGEAVFRSTDAVTWSSYAVVPTSQEATHGVATTELASPPNGAWTTWDRASTVTVRMFNGTLSSATELQVLNGANTMLIGDELIRFATATLNADGTYTLSTLLRGRRGTEWAVDDHTANEIAVVLSGPQHIAMEDTTLNVEAQYAGVTIGSTLEASIRRTVTLTGASQKPYSPCHIEGSRLGSPADLAIEWERRTRIGGAWNDLVDVPLGEETEDYEIDVLNGTTVVRTITTTASAGGSQVNAAARTASYSITDQITDFGSAPSSVSLKVYQMSTLVGRGFARAATV